MFIPPGVFPSWGSSQPTRQSTAGHWRSDTSLQEWLGTLLKGDVLHHHTPLCTMPCDPWGPGLPSPPRSSCPPVQPFVSAVWWPDLSHPMVPLCAHNSGHLPIAYHFCAVTPCRGCGVVSALFSSTILSQTRCTLSPQFSEPPLPQPLCEQRAFPSVTPRVFYQPDVTLLWVFRGQTARPASLPGPPKFP